MAIRQKIYALIGNILQLGHNRVLLKSIDSSIIEVRNSDDSNYAKVRGAPGSGNNDFTTRNQTYQDTAKYLKIMRFNFTFANTTLSIKTLPENVRIFQTRIQITTPFDNSATLQLGKNGGAVNLLTEISDTDPSIAAFYETPQDTSWGAGNAEALITIGNVPTVGAGIATIFFVIDPLT